MNPRWHYAEAERLLEVAKDTEWASGAGRPGRLRADRMRQAAQVHATLALSTTYVPVPIDLQRLRSLAEAATPGPWTGGMRSVRTADGEGVASTDGWGGPLSRGAADAEYIAALSPDVALALINLVLDGDLPHA